MPRSPTDIASLKRFGEHIQQLREGRGWSRAELADLAGFHRRYIRDLEVGTGNASLTSLMSLAAAFDIELAELLAGVDEPQTPRDDPERV